MGLEVEVGQEPSVQEPAPRSPPPTPPAPAPAQVAPQQRNNHFLKRNVRVKEWGSFAIRDSWDSEGQAASSQVQEESTTTSPAPEPAPAPAPGPHPDLAAKQSEVVDTLKRKLQ